MKIGDIQMVVVSNESLNEALDEIKKFANVIEKVPEVPGISFANVKVSATKGRGLESTAIWYFFEHAPFGELQLHKFYQSGKETYQIKMYAKKESQEPVPAPEMVNLFLQEGLSPAEIAEALAAAVERWKESLRDFHTAALDRLQ